MSEQSRKLKVSQVIKNQSLRRIQIIRDKQNESDEKINYCQLQYIIQNKRIAQHIIQFLLRELYKDSYQDINENWLSLKDNKILQDAILIKKKIVQEAWDVYKLTPTHIKNKQACFKNYKNQAKTKKQMALRLKTLKEEMRVLSNKIDMTKNDNQHIQMKKMYQQLRQQMQFWKNKQRKEHQLKLQLSINRSFQNSVQKLKNLWSVVTEIQSQEQRLIQVKRLSIKKDKKQIKYKIQDKIIKKLQAIFFIYSKQYCNETKIFDKIRQSQQYLTLESFIKITIDMELNNILTLTQKVELFKKHSHFKKMLNFAQFIELFNQICHKKCENLKIDINPSIIQNFLQLSIANVNKNHRGNITQLTKQKQKLKNKIASKYRFKIRSHTGMYQQSIQKQLDQRKKLKMNTIQARINRTPRKNMLKNLQLIKLQNNFLTKNNSPSVQQINQSNVHQLLRKKRQKFSLPQFMNKQTYTQIFLRKKCFKMDESRRYGTEIQGSVQKSRLQFTPIDNSLYGQKMSKSPFYNQIDNKCKQNYTFQDQKLNQIIELNQDDPFLTCHMNNYKILNEERTTIRTKIHF